jgi:hypothetical protein
MKELKSKKTGRTSTYSDEEYAAIVNKGVIDLKRFIVTDLRSRPIVPSIKTPVEVEKIPKKHKE